jgi:hypothetical protein
LVIPASPAHPGEAELANARYSGGGRERPEADPISRRMSGRRTVAHVAGVVAVFALCFAVGSALGEDERPAPRHTPAKKTTVRLGSLRLEPAPALPGLRAVRVKRSPKPGAAAAPASAPAVAPRSAPSEPSGASAPSPEPATTSTPPTGSAPPAPSASPAPPPTSAPQQQTAPAPDAAPPASMPAPDPSPNGGSGQFQGGG